MRIQNQRLISLIIYEFIHRSILFSCLYWFSKENGNPAVEKKATSSFNVGGKAIF